MVGDRSRAQSATPLCRFRPRRGRDHRKTRDFGGQLDRDRANSAGTADHQQRLARLCMRRRADLEAIEQSFPGGDRGQWQGGGGCEIKRDRHVPDDAFVDRVQAAVGARARHVAGIEHAIAGLEERHPGADRLHHASRVIAQNARRPGNPGLGHALLAIHRVDRNGLDGDDQVALAWKRVGQFEIDKTGGIADRQRMDGGDGLHGGLLKLGCGSREKAGKRRRGAAPPRREMRIVGPAGPARANAAVAAGRAAHHWAGRPGAVK